MSEWYTYAGTRQYGKMYGFDRFPFRFIDANANATVDGSTGEVVYVVTTAPERRTQQWRTNSPKPTMTARQATEAWQAYLRKSQKP